MNEEKSATEKIEEKYICSHCKMDIRVRNPSGYCDHLYYPENCETCKLMHWNREIEKKNKEIEELQKRKEQRKILDGKAYHCKQCNYYTETFDADKDWVRQQLCYSCHKKQKQELLKKDITEKLIGARITDVDVKGNQIYGITLYNKGMTHELKAQDSGDEYGNGYMEIDDSYRQKDIPMFDDDVKPSQKQRKEKRLP